MTELNFVERIGLEVLRRRIDRAESQSHIHEWSDAELAEIQFESPAQCESRLQALGCIQQGVQATASSVCSVPLPPAPGG